MDNNAKSHRIAEVSILRIYLLRLAYLILSVGLGIMMWPGILNPPMDLPHINTAARSLLGAITLLSLLGIRYPLKMIPLLLFEMLWKFIWLLAFALPRWSAGTMDPIMTDELYSYILTVIILGLILPWTYIFKEYLRVPGDGWRWNKRHDEIHS